MNDQLQLFRNKAISNLTSREKVNLAELEMKKLPQLELKVEHFFSLGVYARHLYIPADTILVGKIHKYENMNILAKGDIAVLVDNEVQRLQAPYTIVSPPGTKRIAYTYTNTLWITIHGTNMIDVDKIEEYFIAQSEQEFLEFCGQQKLRLDVED